MNIQLSAQTLAHVVKGQASFDHDFFITALRSLECAGPNDVAVVLDRGDESVFASSPERTIRASNAGVFIATREWVVGRSYIIVTDTLEALELLVAHRSAQCALSGIHETALIAPDAQIALTAEVGPYAVIKSGAVIGERAVIGAHVIVGIGATVGCDTRFADRVTIGDYCMLGNRTRVQSGAVIGSDGFGYQVTKVGMKFIPHTGIVVVGDDVEIGAGCCIDRALFEATQIGNGVKLDNMVHVAHNVVIGAHTAILAHTSLGGSAHIGTGCQIGGQVAIKDHCVIGDGAKVVSKSAVMRDVPARAVVCGQPAQDFRTWKRMHGMLATLLERWSDIRTLLTPRASVLSRIRSSLFRW